MIMLKQKKVWLDILMDGRFYCQVSYPGEVNDGEIDKVFQYVTFRKPSLKNKLFMITPTNQRVCR